MFTGIIEATGEVIRIEKRGEITNMFIRSPISSGLKPDQSVAHDGVCLTVVSIEQGSHQVQLVEETLRRSHLGEVKEHDVLNLERSMPAQGRFEGHIVQGHVDCVAELIAVEHGLHVFQYPSRYAKYLVEKGSVSINGVSLTIASLSDDTLKVALIPHTLAHTNLGSLQPGMHVNMEFDILAKHIVRMMELREQ